MCILATTQSTRYVDALEANPTNTYAWNSLGHSTGVVCPSMVPSTLGKDATTALRRPIPLTTLLGSTLVRL